MHRRDDVLCVCKHLRMYESITYASYIVYTAISHTVLFADVNSIGYWNDADREES